MSKYLISDTILQDTADSLRAKLETQAKIKPSEFASKIDDIVTNTGAFQVKTIQEMNALTKMKVGDYCVIKGVTTYVVPETATFTRFTGSEADILNGEYENYLFIWRNVNYSSYVVSSDLCLVDSKYQIYMLQMLNTPTITVETDTYDNINTTTFANCIWRFVNVNNNIGIQNLLTYYPRYGKSNIQTNRTTSISELTWRFSNFTYNTANKYYTPKIIRDVSGDIDSNKIYINASDNGTYKYLNTAASTSNNSRYYLYYTKMVTSTPDHLVYQYREGSGWVDVTDDILVPQTTITPTTSVQTPSIPAGYRGFKNITVNAIQTETKTTTPTAVQQVITPASGKYLSQVVVNATPLETITITATTEQQTITPTQGKVGISQITVNPVASSVDPNIVAENIKKGVTILGITGTYEGIVPEDEYDYQLNTAKEIAGIEGGDN